MRQPLPLLLCLVTALIATPITAEQITLSDGRALTGQILYQNDDLILFNSISQGKATPITINRSQIVSAANNTNGHSPAEFNVTPSSQNPTYVHIPLRGEIGYAIDNELLQRAFTLARKSNPTVVILEIDSDGGSVEMAIEMMASITLWRHETQIPLIALVKNRAISAASWLAASCDHIYVTPAASVGGALIYNNSQTEITDTPLGQKMRSIFLSGIRGPITDAGKNQLLIQAMIDPELTISYAILADGEPVIWAGPPAHSPTSENECRQAPRQLVGPGQILTLTASEAVATGLADKYAISVSTLLTDFGIPSAKQASSAPAHVFETRYRQIRSVTERYERLVGSLDGALVKGKGVASIAAVDRKDYTQLIHRLERVRHTVDQMKHLSRQYSWIAQRLNHDLTQDADALLIAIENKIATLKQNMPKPVRKKRSTIKVVITR